MAGIVAQGRDTKYITPVTDGLTINLKTVLNRTQVVLSHHDIEDPRSHVSHAQRVLETRMRGARIDHEGSCKLVNMAESLDDRRVDQTPFPGSQADEPVNGIANLMLVFRHFVQYIYVPMAPKLAVALRRSVGSAIVGMISDTDDTSDTCPDQGPEFRPDRSAVAGSGDHL